MGLSKNNRQFEKDFEISCLFRQDMFAGCVVKSANGLNYAHAGMETLYSGYCMGREHKVRDICQTIKG